MKRLNSKKKIKIKGRHYYLSRRDGTWKVYSIEIITLIMLNKRAFLMFI